MNFIIHLYSEDYDDYSTVSVRDTTPVDAVKRVFCGPGWKPVAWCFMGYDPTQEADIGEALKLRRLEKDANGQWTAQGWFKPVSSPPAPVKEEVPPASEQVDVMEAVRILSKRSY